MIPVIKHKVKMPKGPVCISADRCRDFTCQDFNAYRQNNCRMGIFEECQGKQRGRKENNDMGAKWKGTCEICGKEGLQGNGIVNKHHACPFCKRHMTVALASGTDFYVAVREILKWRDSAKPGFKIPFSWLKNGDGPTAETARDVVVKGQENVAPAETKIIHVDPPENLKLTEPKLSLETRVLFTKKALSPERIDRICAWVADRAKEQMRDPESQLWWMLETAMEQDLQVGVQ